MTHSCDPASFRINPPYADATDQREAPANAGEDALPAPHPSPATFFANGGFASR